MTGPAPSAPGEDHAAYLAERIRDELARHGVHQLGLEVVVEADRIHLTGSVDGPECRTAVVAQVTALAGGRTVVDDLQTPVDTGPGATERIV